uniref:Uncharacterized protein n=1 Tax=Bartonella rochalimae ATCC BAA-1498 TaxID=685782 RepID=E6YNB5_9HYPH|nr:hypothetical protein BARRO_120127 [Bartonella rochalimae ATCC BAA-1498]
MSSLPFADHKNRIDRTTIAALHPVKRVRDFFPQKNKKKKFSLPLI